MCTNVCIKDVLCSSAEPHFRMHVKCFVKPALSSWLPPLKALYSDLSVLPGQTAVFEKEKSRKCHKYLGGFHTKLGEIWSVGSLLGNSSDIRHSCWRKRLVCSNIYLINACGLLHGEWKRLVYHWAEYFWNNLFCCRDRQTLMDFSLYLLQNQTTKKKGPTPRVFISSVFPRHTPDGLSSLCW